MHSIPDFRPGIQIQQCLPEVVSHSDKTLYQSHKNNTNLTRFMKDTLLRLQSETQLKVYIDEDTLYYFKFTI